MQKYRKVKMKEEKNIRRKERGNWGEYRERTANKNEGLYRKKRGCRGYKQK